MFKEILKKIAEQLAKNGIPYMIIGGQAVLLYGEPRLTRDIDITLGVAADKLDTILKITKSLLFKTLPEDVHAFVTETMVLPVLDEGSGIRIDFIFSFTPFEQAAIERVNSIMFDDVPISFASIEDVIIHKIFANRPRDIEDVKNIIRKNRKIDYPYIEKWLKEFSDLFPDEDFLKIFQDLLKE